jgi:hypothetical protein
MMISLAAGPLAAFGAFITGTLEGGFSEGFARAREVLNIFFGAWQRNFNRAVGIVTGFKNDVVAGFNNIKGEAVAIFGDIGDAMGQEIRTGFNTLVPGSVDIPSVTLSAPDWAGGMSTTIGGGSINLPQLQSGGMVDETGMAVVHKGESVIPEPLTSAARSSEGGGGGGTTVEQITINLSGDFDPSDMGRRDLERLAERIDDAIGKKTNTRAGVR